MARKIVFFINPISGTRGKSTLKALIAAAVKPQGFEYEILPTEKDGDYGFLKEKIVHEKITDIVIAGGDGSVSTITGYLIGINVNIGIIPMGSGNSLALCARIPLNPKKALRLIIDGNSSLVDGFYINGMFSCMLSGIGFDGKIAHLFATEKNRGLMGYIKLCLREFFSAAPYPFEVKGQHQLSGSAYFISVANSNQFGNNFTIAPAASLQDGLLDIVIVKKMNKLLLPFYLLAQIAGVNKKGLRNKIAYFQTTELTIINNDLAPIHIDGEPAATSKEFVIKVLPKAFKLIQAG